MPDKPIIIPKEIHRKIVVICISNDLKIKYFVMCLLEEVLNNQELTDKIVKATKARFRTSKNTT